MKRLWCKLFRHQYYVVQEFGPHSRRVACHRCGGDWGMNDSTHSLIRWDGDLRAMYESFGYEIKEPVRGTR